MSSKQFGFRSLVRVSCWCGCIGGILGLVCTGCNSSCSQPLPGSSAPASVSQAPEAEVSGETKLITFKVDGMTCPTGCYPVVKSAIAKQKGVVGIELAPQKEADAIDNPIVFVKYKGNLDLDATFKAISRVGFEASEAPETGASTETPSNGEVKDAGSADSSAKEPA